ncbi:MAG: hypothetical protein ACKOA6_13575 [Actinomycetota bacterium]
MVAAVGAVDWTVLTLFAVVGGEVSRTPIVVSGAVDEVDFGVDLATDVVAMTVVTADDGVEDSFEPPVARPTSATPTSPIATAPPAERTAVFFRRADRTWDEAMKSSAAVLSEFHESADADGPNPLTPFPPAPASSSSDTELRRELLMASDTLPIVRSSFATP